jgi:arabinogalactan endo-1,4-beta-galactosidase
VVSGDPAGDDPAPVATTAPDPPAEPGETTDPGETEVPAEPDAADSSTPDSAGQIDEPPAVDAMDAAPDMQMVGDDLQDAADDSSSVDDVASTNDTPELVDDEPAMARDGAGNPDGVELTVPYILGIDVSFVQEEEDKGIVFVDGGEQKDIFQLLGDHGFNFIRLRIFNEPGNPGGYQNEFVSRAEPYCDTPHTIEMAQRVKAAGMGLLLDFHYSDTWADPDDQHKPAAWEGLSFEELRTAVYDYTHDTLLALDAAGALPDMVQVGNEITPGMLHPDGRSYDPDNWDQLAELLTAGLTAVKEVDDSIVTMLHIDRGGDNDTTVWWVEQAVARGVQFDVLGQSAYTAYHGGPDVWEANFQDMAARHPNLRFVIAEYNGEKRAANDIMHDLPDGRGLGTFFWEPTANGEWGDAMVTWSGSQAVFKPDDLALYDQIATDYGLR